MTKLFCLTLAAIGAAAAAQGATYTERSAFEAATVASYVEGFQSLSTDIIGFDGPALMPSGLLVYSESGRLFVAKPGQSTNPTTALGSNLPVQDSLYLDLGGDFSAFGADIFQNFGSGSQAEDSIYYTIETFLDERFVESVAGLIGPDGGGFLGLTSTNLFDRVRVFASVTDAYEVVDDVTVGTLGVAPVPLPAGLPLLVAALGTLGVLRRRARL